MYRQGFSLALAALLLFSAGSASAGTSEIAPLLDSGHTAWIITASALVLFMTLPGLALFYGGLVRSNNVLSVLLHVSVVACIASIVWLVCGYSLAFSNGGNYQNWIGSFSDSFLSSMSAEDIRDDGLPSNVFFLFQMTFAVITPALVVGVWVERIRFSAVVIFTILFLLLVYIPVTHWIWGGGWLAEMGVMDFAGGLVVHATAGTAALVLALTMRSREGFPSHLSIPHSPGMTMAGASMLWVGWYGFNGGSALAADGLAGSALIATHISAATAGLVWLICDRIVMGKPTLIGLSTGVIAGLASVTPASGYITPLGGLIIGIVGGLLCYGAVMLVRQRMKIDDSLDVFAVHGVGGVTGTILTAYLATGLSNTPAEQLKIQLIGTGAVIAWTAVMMLLIVGIIKLTTSFTVTRSQEIEGLDISAHGEKGYDI